MNKYAFPIFITALTLVLVSLSLQVFLQREGSTGAGVIIAIQGGTATNTKPVAGDMLLSFADNSYGPASIIEGSNMTISTSTFGM